ncbi:hypothetical protein CANCADRAFT_21508 [Tortispora caseinolytica NRRL Y-17796]|uniref:ATP-dependent RNA helicase DBP8 n=1 Tax=Tortispora caseinolytica NRRL Y-17796 TaxID=767744 RepID=A0A1E4TMH7_9ASCO|nr:hypothetical protein CANCADRAFT_21508 [Tortispora caseinolytica NRRL Y-17796]
MSSFTKLGLDPWLDDTLRSMKITSPSQIQSSCIPEILKGRDCIAGAKTGSGKTIAFMAPILHNWARDPSAIYALVLTPTRELAMQIAEQVAALGAPVSCKQSVVIGGMDSIPQSISLANKPNIVVATPGRLADIIKSNGPEVTDSLKRIKYLVLDEADRLLTPTFAEDLDTCITAIPKSDDRQTLLFTATITDAVRSLKDKFAPQGKPPVFVVELDSVLDQSINKIKVPERLSQYYIFLPSYVREAYLHCLLTNEDNADKTCIVFVNHTRTAEILARMLKHLEVRVTALHSQMKQRARIDSLARFRVGAARVLVATDVASRGLDIPNVSLVVNYSIPSDAHDYFHRVGRTARAGNRGTSISLVSERDVDRIHNIENHMTVKLEKYSDKLLNEDMVVEKSIQPVAVAKRQAILELEKDDSSNPREKRRKQRKLTAIGMHKKRI